MPKKKYKSFSYLLFVVKSLKISANVMFNDKANNELVTDGYASTITSTVSTTIQFNFTDQQPKYKVLYLSYHNIENIKAISWAVVHAIASTTFVPLKQSVNKKFHTTLVSKDGEFFEFETYDHNANVTLRVMNSSGVVTNVVQLSPKEMVQLASALYQVQLPTIGVIATMMHMNSGDIDYNLPLSWTPKPEFQAEPSLPPRPEVNVKGTTVAVEKKSMTPDTIDEIFK